MSDRQLTKIEKILTQICEQQTEICNRIEQLEARVGGSPSREETIAFLDQYRAAEAHAENWIGAWIDNCQIDCLKGGLRTVQMREAIHARLLEERLKELGGSPQFELPEGEQERFLTQFGGTQCSDAEKVAALVEEFGDIDRALEPLVTFTNRLDNDQETQFLMRTILQDEHSSVAFLKDACKLLNG